MPRADTVRDYLILQLTAALGAMGEFAGHERRGSLIWPGRSALIGMFGAALGLRRGDDFSALDPLKMAVAIFDPGVALRDYHTVQTVPGAAARQPQSRPQALRDARAKLNTTITLRDYRAAPLYGVAVWGGDLAALADALRRPVFTLYLGRKSCPLAAPLNPQIVAADSPEQALAGLCLPDWRQGAVAQMMASDDTTGAARLETRHDIATDRRQWHFAPRQVAMRAVDIRPGDAP
ncbi:MAG: type I-E CRISPR-associated protein Cas5/CasD [Paracoccus sp. (in: a-proteobacteria)]|uniref:type I-E CRISPR-associated protein Cas5/CasD n=1 Tax=Paracoccus sp. TaxID=267 RepID=UPI0026E0C1E1|nr:type I-E CRISPR-associated protein Cas5/CasD [Paracoccus sp. (in: a-proteobacteria)]MDO5614388.1 type I-E CRISPR-associated protein Cas5/CasD [Paracoccus sp. (in: a-proteobacteria)]